MQINFWKQQMSKYITLLLIKTGFSTEKDRNSIFHNCYDGTENYTHASCYTRNSISQIVNDDWQRKSRNCGTTTRTPAHPILFQQPGLFQTESNSRKFFQFQRFQWISKRNSTWNPQREAPLAFDSFSNSWWIIRHNCWHGRHTKTPFQQKWKPKTNLGRHSNKDCWGGGGGCGVVDVKSWSKMLFLGFFWKITTYWSLLDERVRSSFAESCRN